jgi:hypothetical protein
VARPAAHVGTGRPSAGGFVSRARRRGVPPMPSVDA